MTHQLHLMRCHLPPSLLGAWGAAGLRTLLTVLMLAGAPPLKADVVVGVAVTDNGTMAGRSGAIRDAAEHAAAAINAAGGVLGESVKLVFADDHCSDAGALAAAKTLTAANAKLVIGHPCEKAALAAAAAYATAGTIFIATATRHPALTDKRAGKTLFRLAGREDRQGEAAGQWLADNAKSGRVAIVQDRTAYARGLTAGATAALKARGILAPLIFPIVASEKSYAPVIAGITAGNVEAVYFAGYPAEALIILDGMRKAGQTALFLGCDALAGSEFAAAAIARQPGVRVMLRPDSAPASTSGPLSTNSATLATPANAAEKDAPRDAAAAKSETAMKVWVEAARRAKSVDAALVAAEIQTGMFAIDAGQASPATTLSFDEKGDARVPAFVAGAWTGETWAISSAHLKP